MILLTHISGRHLYLLGMVVDMAKKSPLDKAEAKTNSIITSTHWNGEEFCHYTDIDGLFGIINDSSLRLSAHRFLNDIDEFTYGKDIALEALTDYELSNPTAQINAIFPEVVNIISSSVPIDIDYYITSLSTLKDKLDLWKGYGGKPGSLCMVFSDSIDPALHYSLTHLKNVDVISVTYGKTKQIDMIERIITAYAKQFDQTPVQIRNRCIDQWAQAIAFKIGRLFIGYKDSEYESESEVRLIHKASKTDSVKHRISNGLIIPYVSTNDFATNRHAKLPLKEVIIGPVAGRDALESSISRFLICKGYKNVAVRPSSIRFRG